MFEKNVNMFDFVILDIDLALYRYCLWSGGYSAHALRNVIVIFEKSFCCYLVLLVNMRYSCEYCDPMVDTSLLYKYLQVYRKPCSSCKPNEKWPHTALPCCILFCMKWLIVNRLTRARLMSM